MMCVYNAIIISEFMLIMSSTMYHINACVYSLLSEAYISSGLQLPVDVQGLLSKASSTITQHVWSNHSLPVTDIFCSVGGLRSRVVTVSLDQTCRVCNML